MGDGTDVVDEMHQRVDELIDEYRAALHDSLNGVRKTDTIASVQADYRARWATSRTNLDGRPLDDVVGGPGERPVWALELQVLRELAQHAGHADILREQIIASRSSGS